MGDATVYSFTAQIVRWVDADTVLVDPRVYIQDVYLRVRLRDRWEVEIGEEGHEEALARAKAELGDTGDWLRITNTRHVWTYGRLEARVDRA